MGEERREEEEEGREGGEEEEEGREGGEEDGKGRGGGGGRERIWKRGEERKIDPLNMVIRCIDL